MPSSSSINVSLTPELCEWIAAQVSSGRYRSASEVVRHAVRGLKEQPAITDAQSALQSRSAQ